MPTPSKKINTHAVVSTLVATHKGILVPTELAAANTLVPANQSTVTDQLVPATKSLASDDLDITGQYIATFNHIDSASCTGSNVMESAYAIDTKFSMASYAQTNIIATADVDNILMEIYTPFSPTQDPNIDITDYKTVVVRSSNTAVDDTVRNGS